MPTTSFRFDLDPVLQLRDRAVDQAQAALGQAIQSRTACEAGVRRARAALDLALDTEDHTSRTVRQIGSAAAHREELARQLSEAVQALERSRTTESSTQRALGAAMREREALDTLRSEAADAHRTQALRAETAVLDDLAVLGHAAGARRTNATLAR